MLLVVRFPFSKSPWVPWASCEDKSPSVGTIRSNGPMTISISLQILRENQGYSGITLILAWGVYSQMMEPPTARIT
jgi:hypothetical protein